MQKLNLVSCTDSYKYSHFLQYPPGLERIYSYIESRGGQYPSTLFFGLQAYIKEYLLHPVTLADIDRAEGQVLKHGLPFNRSGWEHIVRAHGGYMPVAIRAVREGTVVPVQNVLVTVENTDEQAPWVVGHLETTLVRAVWYATTVATRSKYIKDVIEHALAETSDAVAPEEKLLWSLHDFGMRGTSSRESAGIAGAAHLVNFLGTDNTDAFDWAEEYYGESMPGFSIPASEHSVATMYGRDNEIAYFRHMIRQFGKPGAIFANVADSYDIYRVCKEILPQIRQELIDSGATMVVRPDSGEPVEVVLRVLELLAVGFGCTVNSKGFRVLRNVRVIQGDGISESTVRNILRAMRDSGFAADNIAFGCGGYLLQALNRDTQKFAMKASAAKISGVWRDIVKDPVTDHGKRSKPGRVSLYTDAGGRFYTAVDGKGLEHMELVFENGVLVREQSFADIRKLAAKAL